MDRILTARLLTIGGSQIVVLPDDCRFEGEEVYVSRDPASGDLVLSTRPDTWALADLFRQLGETETCISR